MIAPHAAKTEADTRKKRNANTASNCIKILKFAQIHSIILRKNYFASLAGFEYRIQIIGLQKIISAFCTVESNIRSLDKYFPKLKLSIKIFLKIFIK